MNFRRSLPAQILMLNVGQGKSFRKRTRKSFEITHFVTPLSLPIITGTGVDDKKGQNMANIQIFTSPEFGDIRTVKEDTAHE